MLSKLGCACCGTVCNWGEWGDVDCSCGDTAVEVLVGVTLLDVVADSIGEFLGCCAN